MVRISKWGFSIAGFKVVAFIGYLGFIVSLSKSENRDSNFSGSSIHQSVRSRPPRGCCVLEGEWMKQIVRNLTDADDGFLNGIRYLIHDREPQYTQAFSELLKSSSVKAVKLPARSPNLNAYAERFIRSIKSECLAQTIPLGERHPRKAVKEYTEHYHFECNHQRRGNELIEKPGDGPNMDGVVECQERLGDVIKYYFRRAV